MHLVTLGQVLCQCLGDVLHTTQVRWVEAGHLDDDVSLLGADHRAKVASSPLSMYRTFGLPPM